MHRKTINSVIKPELTCFIESLRRWTPRELFDASSSRGFIGQDEAHRAMCLFFWRHLNRLRRIHIHKCDRKLLPKRPTMLLAGPTGSGKTMLTKILCESTGIPWFQVSCDSLTPAGYKGDNLHQSLNQMAESCGATNAMISVGVLFLDELDSLSLGYNGDASCQDPLNYRLQKEILKLLDGDKITHCPDFLESFYKVDRFEDNSTDISDLAVIGAGVFGISSSAACESSFASGGLRARRLTRDLIPELRGRFQTIAHFQAHDRASLTAILNRDHLKCHAREMAMERISLHVDDDVIDHIVTQCLESGTGARGLNAITEWLEAACFDAYSTHQDAARILRLYLGPDGPEWEIEQSGASQNVVSIG